VATSELGQLLGLSGDVRIDFVESPALRDNPLGDPARRPLAVYTPPAFDAQASRRYPVLYVLHGYTGDVAALVAGKPWETNVVQWADRLIVAGAMRPLLLVVVDGFTRLGGSQYVDSIHNGAYATYVIRDVIGHIDSHYPVSPREGARAVLGKSSGGFGALHLTMQYPGTFCAFASHSGDMNFRACYPAAFVNAQRTLETFGGDIGAFVAAFEAKPKRSQAEFQTIETLGYTSAYSPRSNAAFSLDLPFEPRTGELREDVFGRWLSYDPALVCLQKKPELERLRLRYLDAGRRDEYALDLGARVFAGHLQDMGLRVRHEEFDDDHRNVGYRYAVSLPALAEVLEFE